MHRKNGTNQFESVLPKVNSYSKGAFSKNSTQQMSTVEATCSIEGVNNVLSDS